MCWHHMRFLHIFAKMSISIVNTGTVQVVAAQIPGTLLGDTRRLQRTCVLLYIDVAALAGTCHDLPFAPPIFLHTTYYTPVKNACNKKERNYYLYTPVGNVSGWHMPVLAFQVCQRRD